MAGWAAAAGFVAFGPGPRAPTSAPPTVPAAAADAPPVPAPIPWDDMVEYAVQPEDTVAGIARLFAVPEDELRRVNHLPPGGEFRRAQRISIPPP